MDSQVIITIGTILASAGIWKFLEFRLKLKTDYKKESVQNSDGVQYRDDLKNRVARLEQLLEESNTKVLELTAEVHALRTEVGFLKKENDRLRRMIDRVTKNWKTTAVGAVLFAAGIILVAMEKATLTEAGTFFGVAFMLFFSKDKLNG